MSDHALNGGFVEVGVLLLFDPALQQLSVGLNVGFSQFDITVEIDQCAEQTLKVFVVFLKQVINLTRANKHQLKIEGDNIWHE